MKKLLIFLAFSFLFLGTSQTVKAQFIVEDPAMLTATVTNWTQQLERALEQYNEMKGQTKIMQEQIERFKKVNQTIKNSAQVANIIQKQVQLISLISGDISNAGKGVLNQDAYNSYMRRMNNYSTASQNNVTMLKAILSDENMKLSDFERLQMIEQLDNKTNALIETVSLETKEYEHLNKTLRELNKLMGK